MAIDEKSSYYDAGGIEVMNIIKAKLTPEQFKGFLLGNVLKYSSRYNFKHSDGDNYRDIEKIVNYSKLLLENFGHAEDCGCDGNCGDACKCEGGCKDVEIATRRLKEIEDGEVEAISIEELQEELKPDTGTKTYFIEQWLKDHNINDYELKLGGYYPIYENCFVCGDSNGPHRLVDKEDKPGVCKTCFAICSNCYTYLENKMCEAKYPADKWLEEHDIEDYELVLGGNDTTIHKDCGICGGEAHSLVVDLSNDMGYPICGICFEYLQNMDGAK
jgi:hypothetical protein